MKLKVQVNSERPNNIGLSTLHKHLFKGLRLLALLNDCHVYQIQFSEKIPQEFIEINYHTKMALFQMDEPSQIIVKPFDTKPCHRLEQFTIFISLVKRPPQIIQLQISELQREIKMGNIVINNGVYFSFRIKDIQMQFRAQLPQNIPYGEITEESVVTFQKEPHQRIDIIDDTPDKEKIFENDQSKVKNLKVGGLHEQLQLIYRRVFVTRMLHPKIVRQLGLKHIKGMLLYGPPGTGKTLIARQISKILKVLPKIVNGPEIFNEFVGKSEEKIRQLFQDARKEQQQKGSKSQLHCIIFDQIDAICKKRGTQTSNGVYDLIVNQLLTCIDGINSLNNILVIGITNRKDLIDQAVLRPGRLEVHIEVNIPDESGRIEVLEIHTELMKKNGFLDDSVNLKELAKIAKNYTGAELEGVVKSAQSFALQRWKKFPNDVQSKEKCKVTQEDLIKGMTEVLPQFGKDNSILQAILRRDKIIIPKYEQIRANISNAMNHLEYGKHTFLIRGDAGTGKTFLAAECAILKECSFIKIINCDRFLGLNQGQIMNEIVRIFQDAQRCNNSLIVLDDILRLIDFVPLGPRYNSSILNLIINLIKKVINPTKKQIIVSTVTNAKQFEDLGMLRYFKHVYNMEKLNSEQISDVLKGLGFEDTAAMSIGRQIGRSTVSEIVDTTKIQGQKSEEEWLKCWNQSRSMITLLK